MCLSKVNKVKTYPKNHIGYKLADIDSTGKLNLSPCQTRLAFLEYQHFYPLNEWIKDAKKGRIANNEYLSGFHIFPSIKDLLRFVGMFGWASCAIVKVKFRNVRATGTQDRSIHVIVVKEMKAIEVLYNSISEHREELKFKGW